MVIISLYEFAHGFEAATHGKFGKLIAAWQFSPDEEADFIRPIVEKRILDFLVHPNSVKAHVFDGLKVGSISFVRIRRQ